ELRVMDAERRLMQKTVEAYEQSLALTRNRYDAGIAAQADIEISTAQLENARAQALALERQRVQLENAIAVLLGRAPAEFSLPETQSRRVCPSCPSRCLPSCCSGARMSLPRSAVPRRRTPASASPRPPGFRT